MAQVVITYKADAAADRPFAFTCACRNAPTDRTSRESRRLRCRAGYGASPGKENLAIRMNTFIYLDAAHGPCRRCGIKILPGQSPIRTALAGSEILAVPGEPRLKEYPLEGIVYDEVRSFPGSDRLSPSVPPVLLQQLDDLPEDIADRTEIYPDGDLLLLSLPLSNPYRLCVVYRIAVLPLQIHSVGLLDVRAKSTEDVTQHVLANDRCPSLGILLGLARRRLGSADGQAPILLGQPQFWDTPRTLRT